MRYWNGYRRIKLVNSRVDADRRSAFLADVAQVAEPLLGFSKASMETGDYNQAAVMKAGLSVWRELEAELAGWRRQHRGMLMLAAFCCVKDSLDNP